MKYQSPWDASPAGRRLRGTKSGVTRGPRDFGLRAVSYVGFEETWDFVARTRRALSPPSIAGPGLLGPSRRTPSSSAPRRAARGSNFQLSSFCAAPRRSAAVRPVSLHVAPLARERAGRGRHCASITCTHPRPRRTGCIKHASSTRPVFDQHQRGVLDIRFAPRTDSVRCSVPTLRARQCRIYIPTVNKSAYLPSKTIPDTPFLTGPMRRICPCCTRSRPRIGADLLSVLAMTRVPMD